MASEEINMKVETKKLAQKTIFFFRGKDKLIAPIIFLACIGYCIFLWYSYVYNSQWSENQKQEYKNNQGKEIVFDEKKFNNVVASIENRQTEFNKKVDNVNDIFQINK